jgi:hypothetical protein
VIAFALTILLGAFLVFQVQPIIGRHILPWYGGTPAVWSACMLFFQAMLLAGYGYAHLLAAGLSPRRQAWLHSGLLLLAAGLLAVQAGLWGTPLLPDSGFTPDAATAPIGWILLTLACGVGLPYLLLAASSPLLQAWVHRASGGRSPYRLYALSNVGAVLALVSYPFLFEPLLAVPTQGWLWAAAFVLFAAGSLVCAARLLRSGSRDEPATAAGRAAPPAPPPPPRRVVLWLALTAAPSALLLAVTNEICQDVAVVPFLWVLPLTLYLLSFILTFDSERWYRRRLFIPAFWVAAGLSLVTLLMGNAAGITARIVIHSGALWIGCMVCHGELVRSKPHPSRLTGFYLAVSLGGALGGLFVNLLAPLLFDGYWELNLSLLAVALLALLRRWNAAGGWLAGPRRRLRRSLALAALATLGIGLAAQPWVESAELTWAERDFFGVVRVRTLVPDDPRQRCIEMLHGATVHGFQFDHPALRRQPSGYFGPASGAGLALDHMRRRQPQGLRVGVVGLGIGTLATYGRPGDRFRFYELAPLVIELAEGAGGYFSYLDDSRAHIEVIQGDGRLSLQRELEDSGPQRFDVLLLDAFSSDSIPTHLLTSEAFDLYLAHLAPDGILAANVTNAYLAPVRVVLNQADRLGLAAVLVHDSGDGWHTVTSSWVLMSRDRSWLDSPALAAHRIPDPVWRRARAIATWTDAYSNLLAITP